MAPDARAVEALRRGDVYRALALGFDYPSEANADTLESLLRDLAAVHRETPGLTAPAALTALEREWLADRHAAYREHYHALFDLQGALGYCESAWRRVDRGAVLRDVTAFYRAFGFAAPGGEGQADSLRHELAFLSYLAYQEWFALQNGLREQAGITRRAQASFLGDHLSIWVERFAERLRERASDSVYARLADLLSFWAAEERSRFGLQEPLQVDATLEAMADPLAGGCPAAATHPTLRTDEASGPGP